MSTDHILGALDIIRSTATYLLPIVASLRCTCGNEIRAEVLLRQHQPSPDEIKEAYRRARRDVAVLAESEGWSVSPHGQPVRDVCPRKACRL